MSDPPYPRWQRDVCVGVLATAVSATIGLTWYRFAPPGLTGPGTSFRHLILIIAAVSGILFAVLAALRPRLRPRKSSEESSHAQRR